MENKYFSLKLTQKQRLEVARWYDKSLVASDKEVDIIADHVEEVLSNALIMSLNDIRLEIEKPKDDFKEFYAEIKKRIN
jgi:hypothetical protein